MKRYIVSMPARKTLAQSPRSASAQHPTADRRYPASQSIKHQTPKCNLFADPVNACAQSLGASPSCVARQSRTKASSTGWYVCKLEQQHATPKNCTCTQSRCTGATCPARQKQQDAQRHINCKGCHVHVGAAVQSQHPELHACTFDTGT
jgi:hypothetical protein